MIYIVTFTGNQVINQLVNMFHCRRVLTFATIITNMVICRKVKNAKPQRWRVCGISQGGNFTPCRALLIQMVAPKVVDRHLLTIATSQAPRFP
jgi:hypothetical protein